MAKKKYYWCLHCEQATPATEWKANGFKCPVEDCDGGPLDVHDWSKTDWPREVHPEYPEIPVLGTVYPLYGD